jgi:hypothetical protein
MDEKRVDPYDVRQVIVISRVIVLALASGVVTFGAIALIIGGLDTQAPLQVLTVMSAIFGGGALVMGFVLPTLFVTAQVRQIASEPGEGSRSGDAKRLAMAFHTKTILSCALLEGAAFLALIAVMIEHHLAGLVVAAVLLTAILSHFPSPPGVTEWIDERLRQVDELRNLAGRSPRR